MTSYQVGRGVRVRDGSPEGLRGESCLRRRLGNCRSIINLGVFRRERVQDRTRGPGNFISGGVDGVGGGAPQSRRRRGGGVPDHRRIGRKRNLGVATEAVAEGRMESDFLGVGLQGRGRRRRGSLHGSAASVALLDGGDYGFRLGGGGEADEVKLREEIDCVAGVGAGVEAAGFLGFLEVHRRFSVVNCCARKLSCFVR